MADSTSRRIRLANTQTNVEKPRTIATDAATVPLSTGRRIQPIGTERVKIEGPAPHANMPFQLTRDAEKRLAEHYEPDYRLGNIDIRKDPVKGFTGKRYTVYNDMRTGENVVIPAAKVNALGIGVQLSEEEAAKQYLETGQYYGKFKPTLQEKELTDYLRELEFEAQKWRLKKGVDTYSVVDDMVDTENGWAKKQNPILDKITGPEDSDPQKEMAGIRADAHKSLLYDRELNKMREQFGESSESAVGTLGLATASGLSGFTGGFENALSGTKELLGGKPSGATDSALRRNDALQQVAAEERSEMSTAQGIIFDMTQSFAQNAPSMALNVATGGIFGTALTFAYTYGNELHYAKKAGADKKTAVTYAFLDGLAQAYLEYLGYLPGVGTVTKGAANALAKNVSNATLKLIGRIGVNSLGEFVTEDLQTVIENGLRNAAFGEQNETSIFSEEALYSGFLGMLSAGVMDGISTTASAVANRAEITKIGRNYLGDNAKVKEALEIGLANAKSSEIYRTAQNLETKFNNNKTISAYELGKLVADSQTKKAILAREIERFALESAQEHNVEPKVAEEVAAVAARLGRQVLFDSADNMKTIGKDGRTYYESGRYDPHTGTIKLNAGAKSTALVDYVLKHELAHSVERTKLGTQLEKIVRGSMGAQFDTAVQEKITEYQRYGKPLSEADAKHEVVAHWLGQNLYQNGFAQAVVNGDAKVGNVILRTLDQVRLALGGTQKSRTAANIAIVERLFMRALEQSPALDSNGEVQYSIETLPDGRRYVKADRQVIFGEDPSQWEQQIIDYVNDVVRGGQDMTIPTQEGDVLTINGRTAWKLGYRNDTPNGKIDDATYRLKGDAAGHIDELAEVSALKKSKPNLKPNRRMPFGRDGFDYRTAYFLDKDNSYYQLMLSVGVDGNVKTVYNIGDIKKVPFPVTGSKAKTGTTPYDNTVAHSETVVNTQYMQSDAKNSQSSFEGSDDIAEALAMMEREQAEKAAVPVEENGTLPLSRQSPTDPLTRGTEGDVQDAGVTPATDIPNPLESGRVLEHTQSNAQTVDELTAEIGEEAVYRRMYNAAQIERPPSTMEINGQTVDTVAYMDELFLSLPDDDLQLTAYLKEKEAAKAAQLAEQFARGETDTGWTELDLQIQTARSKLEWSALEDSGESGKKVRRFYEQRLKGKDVNKAHETELLELLAGRNETYSPIANQKTLERAKDKLRNADYQATLRKRILRYKPNDLFNAVDAAAAQVMINDARNEGDLELYADLVQGLSRKGTELGRAVQVLSMQRRMTPEGTLKAAQRTLRSQADRALYDGADEDLDIFSERITDAIERAEAAAQGTETAVIDMLEKIRSGQFKQNDKVFFGSVTPSVASKIKGLTGIDVSDFQVAIEARQLQHILSDHGPQGTTDHSMADDYNIAKMGHVVSNPDDIRLSGKTNAYTYTQEGKTRLADTVLYEKNIGENSYYVVQAVANTKKKTLYIVTAFEGKSGYKKTGVQQLADAINPDATSTTEFAGTPTNNIAQSEPVVNVEVPLTREEITDALVQDIAGDNSPYITADEIRGILERAVENACDIPDQLRRHLKKALGKDMGTLAQRIAEMHKAGHLNDMTMRRVMEETLGLPTLTEEDVKTLTGLVNELNNAQEQSAEQLEAMENIYRFLGEKLIVTKLDALQSWRKFGMLFNAKTHFRNILSNAVFAGVDRLDGLTATALERIMIRDAQNRTAAFGWSLTEHGRQIRPVVKKSAEQALLRMRGQGQKYEVSTGVLNQYRKAFGTSKGGEILNSLSETNSQLLEVEDSKFFIPAYENALGQLMVARGLTETNSNIEEIAYKRAIEAVFRGENAMTDVLTSIKRYQNSNKTGRALFGHAVDVAIPFTKTPANIAYQSVQHSPIGLVKGAFDILQATRGKGAKSMAEAINTFSKGVTGSVLLGIGMLLGSTGVFVTGFGKTEKERAADELAGIQENAFRFGNVTISFDWLQPAASPLIVGASIAQRFKEDGLSLGSVFGAVFDGTDSMFEMTMLQSLYDVLGGYNAGASASVASVAENLISQSLPTVFGQVARAIDPVQRKTNGESALSSVIGTGTFAKILQKVMAKVPGLTYLLEPELDVWGNTVYRTGKASTVSGVLNALQQFVLPANVKIGTGDDEISQIVMELYNSDEAQPGRAIPTAITREKAAEMGVSYEDVNRFLGQKQYGTLLALLEDRQKYTVTQQITRGGKTVKQKRKKYWSDMTDEERLQVLKQVYREEKENITDPDGEYYEEIVRRMK